MASIFADDATRELEKFQQRMLYEDMKDEAEREKWIGDPIYLEKLGAHFARSMVPEKVLAKLPQNATLAKLLDKIPNADPRKGILGETLIEAPGAISKSMFEHPANVVAKLFSGKFAANKEDIYKYIRGEENRWLFKSEPPSAPGYDEWKKEHPGLYWSSPSSSFAWGAGITA